MARLECAFLIFMQQKLENMYPNDLYLFDLIFYVPVNNPSVMSGGVLGLTNTKQICMCLAQ